MDRLGFKQTSKTDAALTADLPVLTTIIPKYVDIATQNDVDT